MNFIDIFFRLLNFALFAGVVSYYFRTRLLSNVYAQIKAKIKSYTATSVAIKQAKNDFKALQGQIEAQKTEYNALQQKIALWKDALREKDKQCAQNQTMLNERLAERALLREKTGELCKESQRVFPLVINQATEELKNIFIEKEQQKGYNQKALNALEHIARLG